MPEWSNRPPQKSEFAGIRLVRVPAKGSIRGLVTSTHLLGCLTHYYRQRTAPCEGVNCQACRDGHAPRWHGYISYLDANGHNHRVLELTALAAQAVAEFDDRNGTLRGAIFYAERTGGRPNSPVAVTVEPHDTDLRKLPDPLDLEKFLTTIWAEGTRRLTAPPKHDDADQLPDADTDISRPRNRLTGRTKAANNGDH